MEKRFKEGGASLRQEKGGLLLLRLLPGGDPGDPGCSKLGVAVGRCGGVDKAAKLRIKPGHRRATALSGGK